jgi:hypothetical protein
MRGQHPVEFAPIADIFDFWQDLHCFAGIARDDREFCAVLQDVIDDFRDVVVDADPIAKISGNKWV